MISHLEIDYNFYMPFIQTKGECKYGVPKIGGGDHGFSQKEWVAIYQFLLRCLRCQTM
jgi:hypothetical protein